MFKDYGSGHGRRLIIHGRDTGKRATGGFSLAPLRPGLFYSPIFYDLLRRSLAANENFTVHRLHRPFPLPSSLSLSLSLSAILYLQSYVYGLPIAASTNFSEPFFYVLIETKDLTSNWKQSEAVSKL